MKLSKILLISSLLLLPLVGKCADVSIGEDKCADANVDEDEWEYYVDQDEFTDRKTYVSTVKGETEKGFFGAYHGCLAVLCIHDSDNNPYISIDINTGEVIDSSYEKSNKRLKTIYGVDK